MWGEYVRHGDVHLVVWVVTVDVMEHHLLVDTALPPVLNNFGLG